MRHQQSRIAKLGYIWSGVLAFLLIFIGSTKLIYCNPYLNQVKLPPNTSPVVMGAAIDSRGFHFLGTETLLVYDGKNLRRVKDVDQFVLDVVYNPYDDRIWFTAGSRVGYVKHDISQGWYAVYIDAPDMAASGETLWNVHPHGEDIWITGQESVYLYRAGQLHSWAFDIKQRVQLFIVDDQVYVINRLDNLYHIDSHTLELNPVEFEYPQSIHENGLICYYKHGPRTEGLVMTGYIYDIVHEDGVLQFYKKHDIEFKLDELIFTHFYSDGLLILNTTGGAYWLDPTSNRTTPQALVNLSDKNSALEGHKAENGIYWISSNKGYWAVSNSITINPIRGMLQPQAYKGSLYYHDFKYLNQYDEGESEVISEGNIQTLLLAGDDLLISTAKGLKSYQTGEFVHSEYTHLSVLHYDPTTRTLFEFKENEIRAYEKIEGKWTVLHRVSINSAIVSQLLYEPLSQKFYASYFAGNVLRLYYDPSEGFVIDTYLERSEKGEGYVYIYKSGDTVHFMTKDHELKEIGDSLVPMENDGRVLQWIGDVGDDTVKVYRLKDFDSAPLMEIDNGEEVRSILLPALEDGQAGIISRVLLIDDKYHVASTNSLILVDKDYRQEHRFYEPVLKVTGDYEEGANQLRFDFNKNDMSIEVAYPNFLMGQNVKIETRLADYDSAWVELKDEYTRDFINLDSGLHTLSVRITHPVLGQRVIEALKVYVAPPWYLRWYSLIGYAVLLGVLVYLIVKFRERQLIAYSMQLEAELDVRMLRERTMLKEISRQNMYWQNFLGTLNHEIARPLGLLKLNLNRINIHEESQRGLNRSIREIESLTREAREVCMLQSDNMDTHFDVVKLNSIIQEELELFELIAKEKSVDLNVNADDVESVVSDGVLIKRILSNFLSNAIKYSPQGGKIDITLEKSSKCMEGFVQITLGVRDYGKGVASDIVDKLFTPITYMDRLGHGQGLNIVRQYADILGGSVWHKEPEGEGSLFGMEFELATQKAYEYRKQQSKELNVLVVDENEHSLNRIEQFYTLFGIYCYTASSGQAALDWMKQKSFDIVIIDFELPNMNGVQFIDNYRQYHKDKARYLYCLTSYVEGDNRMSLVDSGYSAVFKKPLSKDALFKMICI